MSRTDAITPDAVYRIGLSLAAQLDDVPARAFTDTSDKRLGAILNLSPSTTRDALLEGLEEQDSAFAEQVRKSIFTFADIPARIAPADIPRILREVDQPTLVVALRFAADSGAAGQTVVDHLLGNISKRMAEGLREEMAELAAIKEKPGEEAQNAVIAAIRLLEDAGEIVLRVPEDPEDN